MSHNDLAVLFTQLWCRAVLKLGGQAESTFLWTKKLSEGKMEWDYMQHTHA